MTRAEYRAFRTLYRGNGRYCLRWLPDSQVAAARHLIDIWAERSNSLEYRAWAVATRTYRSLRVMLAITCPRHILDAWRARSVQA